MDYFVTFLRVAFGLMGLVYAVEQVVEWGETGGYLPNLSGFLPSAPGTFLQRLLRRPAGIFFGVMFIVLVLSVIGYTITGWLPIARLVLICVALILLTPLWKIPSLVRRTARLIANRTRPNPLAIYHMVACSRTWDPEKDDMDGAAIQDATLALQAEPNNVEALLVRAIAYNNLQRYDAAIADATRAMQLDPRSVPAIHQRASAYYHVGRFGDAIQDATRGLRIDRTQLHLWLILAEAGRAVGAYLPAIQAATAALQIAPSDVFALRTRAESYRGMGRFTEAIRDATEALRIEPENVRALGTRAAACCAAERYTEAIQDAREALKIEPGNSAMQELLEWLSSQKRAC